ncbi:MAG TPA: monovalent cation/H(+) antiporter subunit G [Hyphomicrobiales bacterium]|nr:monovalent cation/H(+) antiporter subunit G [Hyphomicrobiales bacterium]
MILQLAADILSWFFILAGSAGIVIAAFGLVRLPDFYTRLHAGGVTDTLGAEMILIGLAIQSGFTLVTVKLIIIGMFLIFTGPTATHATANAAWVAGLKPRLAEQPDEPSPEPSPETSPETYRGDRP